jgi:ubiquinone/menaquinone biosynthesis C-methylase UbiE
VAELAGEFTTIRVSGRHLGTIAVLEDRAAVAGYGQMVDTLFDHLGVGASDDVVEVGCGSGALVRQLAHRLGGGSRIRAVDLSPFQVDEARAIAEGDPVSSDIQFELGNAEHLPLDDESVDIAFAVTVFEECDADRAIAEMHRVLRPGGRAGIVVRAADLPNFFNVEVPEEVTEAMADQGALVGPGGCADRSLYSRVSKRFTNLTPYAHWWTSSPPLPAIVGFRLASLSDAHREMFLAALDRDTAAGTSFLSTPVHCVTAQKA